MKVAEQLAAICHAEGVRLYAGITGESAGHLVDAFSGNSEAKLIYCRQERVAVDVCDGYARVTGQPGVVFTDAGPGAANAMGGVVNSWGDSVPVLFFAPIIVGGRIEASAQRYGKELPIADLFTPVTKWTAIIADADQVDSVMRRAFARLRAPRSGPVVIGIPNALAGAQAKPSHYEPANAPVRNGAAEEKVKAALAMLANAERPYLYAGAGVLTSGATDELLELAELLTLPVATTLNGKSAFPEDHPLSLGIGGFARATYGTLQATRIATEADVALTVGCGFKRDAVKEPMSDDTKLIQVDVDPGEFNNVVRADIGLAGDAKVILRQMIDAAASTLPKDRLAPRASVIERVAKLRERWWDICSPMLTSGEQPINPFRITYELNQLVDHARTIVLHDAGGSRGYACQHYVTNRPHGFVGFGVESAMGWSIGAAIGAKVAAPDHLVVTFIGDEAFCETAMDLETSVVCDTPILVILINNRADAMKRLGDRSIGHIRWKGGSDLSKLALALGAEAHRVEDPDLVRSTLERAIKTVGEGRTCVVEVVATRARHHFAELLTKEAAGI